MIDWKQVESVGMGVVIERYGIHPDYKGFIRCPFHGDKGPSMRIYDKSYYCYGCHAHGDNIDFVAEMERIPKTDAARIIMERCGINESDAESVRRVRDRQSREQSDRELWLNVLKAMHRELCRQKDAIQRRMRESEVGLSIWFDAVRTVRLDTPPPFSEQFYKDADDLVYIIGMLQWVENEFEEVRVRETIGWSCENGKQDSHGRSVDRGKDKAVPGRIQRHLR